MVERASENQSGTEVFLCRSLSTLIKVSFSVSAGDLQSSEGVVLVWSISFISLGRIMLLMINQGFNVHLYVPRRLYSLETFKEV